MTFVAVIDAELELGQVIDSQQQPPAGHILSKTERFPLKAFHKKHNMKQ